MALTILEVITPPLTVAKFRLEAMKLPLVPLKVAGPRHVAATVCQVTKPLVAVAEMVGSDRPVIFDDAGRCSIHKPSGTETPFTLHNNQFEIIVYVPNQPREQQQLRESTGVPSGVPVLRGPVGQP